MLAFKLAGKNPMASVQEAVEGHTTAQRFSDVLAGFLSSCHLLKRDASGLNLWRTPKGEIWAPSADSMKDLCWVLTEVAVGVYGSPDVSVRPGDTVIDCGASIGLFARDAIAAGADRIIAIEPASLNVECLRRNLRSHITSGRVVLLEKGIWDSDGLLPFTLSERSSLANSFVMGAGPKPDANLTPVTTLDHVVEHLGLSRIDLVKMDVEGAEQRALQGGRKLLIRDRPRLAIGVEHELPTILDNAKAVRNIVLKINPAYKLHCGLCIEGSNRMIAPQVLWFH
jgi:FkbM family methyltransferase